MAHIRSARVHVRGLRPLLWHHFGPESIPLERQERTGVPGNDPDEALRTVLMTAERELYVPGTYVFGSIRDGARHVKKGRGSIQTAVASTLQVKENRIPLGLYVPEVPEKDPTQPVFVDCRSCKNPQTKGRNIRYRIAAKEGWQFGFSLLWDAAIVSSGEMKGALDYAGQLAGIGDGRAIGFGRFEVSSFDTAE